MAILVASFFLLFHEEFYNFFIPIIPLVFLVFASLGMIWLWVEFLILKVGEVVGKTGKNLFLDDRAIGETGGKKIADDLGFLEDAKKFAEDVLNGGSDNPIVFGLDAPWGSGKSSYLNLCQMEVWDKKREDVIVFRFKPVLYDCRKQNLFSLFSGDLLRVLKNNSVETRVLKSHISSYQKFLNGSAFSFFGFSFSFKGFVEQSSETLLNNIRHDLGSLSKKVIIIIDDLDRLYLEDVKEMIGIVRNIFYVPNVTFILCYDTSNINSFEVQHKTTHNKKYKVANGLMEEASEYSYTSDELDNQKINAYFEKIVQVKKTLLLKRECLEKYLISNLEEIVNPEFTYHFDKLKEAIKYFFKESNYPFYERYFGDIRKIKRVINVFIERNILNIRYKSLDPDPIQYIQLVLIYINYPHIFKKIYVHESNGNGGFFSVVGKEYERDRDDSELRFVNSREYKNYIKTLNQDERELVQALFEVDEKQRNSEIRKKKDDKEFTSSSLFFNGPFPYARNLKGALNLIVEKIEPPITNQYSFHLSSVKLLSKKSIEEIFEDPVYHAENGEEPREIFFRTILGKLKENDVISFKIFDGIVDYMVGNLHKYSLVDGFSSVYDGLRDTLT